MQSFAAVERVDEDGGFKRTVKIESGFYVLAS